MSTSRRINRWVATGVVVCAGVAPGAAAARVHRGGAAATTRMQRVEALMSRLAQRRFSAAFMRRVDQTQPVPGPLAPNATTGTPTAKCPPYLNGDGTVTFRWCLPGATSVSLSDDGGSVTLTQDQKTGVWSGTQAVPDGLYNYSYTVNGASGLPDPSNPPWNLEQDAPFGSGPATPSGLGSPSENSQIFVPAANDPANPIEYYGWLSPDNAVAHGTLEQYLISTPNSTGPYAGGHHPVSVYLPPGYNAGCSARYPVLYLSHGSGGDDVDWSTQGYAGIIEDNLLAAGLAKPAIIVMTNFNNTAPGTGPTTGVTDPVMPVDGYRVDLEQAYIPWADSHFCTQADRAGRAFAGLSEGGAITLNIIQNDAKQFAYFGIWSPVCLDPNCVGALATAPDVSTLTAVQYGAGVGDEFGAYANSYEETADLTAAGVPNRRHMTPVDNDGPAPPALDPGTPGSVDEHWRQGTGHTWDSWREQLRDALMTTFFQLN